MIYKLLNVQAFHFKLDHVEIKPEALTFILESRFKGSRCPHCNKYSNHIHSRYQRSIQDLPCFAHKTHIQLIAHKFYCRNPNCPKKIFTERFTCGITPFKRRTDRLSELLSALCLQASCRSAERICKLLYIQVSDTTLGRLLHTQSLPDFQTPKVLGVDDWALKKRNRYGTILVDLEQHKIIDLLKDRESSTLQTWLEEHTEVQIVSRDRYTNYTNAITAALPHAVQVVDRWHLLKNLCDGLGKLVERNHQHLKYAGEREIQRLQRAHIRQVSKKVTSQRKAATENFSLRQWQLQQIKSYQNQGVAIMAMARQLNMSRNTVKKYLHLQEPPRRKSLLRVNIAVFDTYIRTRIQEEPDIQLNQLYREIKQRGYNGARSTACLHFHEYVNRAPRFTRSRLPDVFYLPSKVPFLLLRKKELLPKREQKLVAHLCSKCPQIKIASVFAIQFKQMMENKKGSLLKRWIDKAINCGITELKGFAKGLLGDFDAVRNALTMPWSNGQVEGQINKLKTIKRQMYGRSSFELLRKRLLLDSS